MNSAKVETINPKVILLDDLGFSLEEREQIRGFQRDPSSIAEYFGVKSSKTEDKMRLLRGVVLSKCTMIKYVPEYLLTNELIELSIRKWGDTLKYISKALHKKEYFDILSQRSSNIILKDYFPKELINKRLALDLLTKQPSNVKNVFKKYPEFQTQEFYDELSNCNPSVFTYMTTCVIRKLPKNISLKVIQKHLDFLRYIPLEDFDLDYVDSVHIAIDNINKSTDYSDIRQIRNASLYYFEDYIQKLPERLLTKEIVLFIIQNNFFNYKKLELTLKNYDKDFEICKNAFMCDPTSIIQFDTSVTTDSNLIQIFDYCDQLYRKNNYAGSCDKVFRLKQEKYLNDFTKLFNTYETWEALNRLLNNNQTIAETIYEFIDTCDLPPAVLKYDVCLSDCLRQNKIEEYIPVEFVEDITKELEKQQEERDHQNQMDILQAEKLKEEQEYQKYIDRQKEKIKLQKELNQLQERSIESGTTEPIPINKPLHEVKNSIELKHLNTMDYDYYLLSHHWVMTRKRALQFYSHKCQLDRI